MDDVEKVYGGCVERVMIKAQCTTAHQTVNYFTSSQNYPSNQKKKPEEPIQLLLLKKRGIKNEANKCFGLFPFKLWMFACEQLHIVTDAESVNVRCQLLSFSLILFCRIYNLYTFTVTLTLTPTHTHTVYKLLLSNRLSRIQYN